MPARCGLHSTEVVPNIASPRCFGAAQVGPEGGVTRLYIQDMRRALAHIAQHDSPRDLYPAECDLIVMDMDYLPHLGLAPRPIGHPTEGACFAGTGGYIGSPLPFLQVTPAVVAPPPFPPSPSSSPSPPPASPLHRTPHACHGVERRMRSRPSSHAGRGYQHVPKLTRVERAAAKAASSRGVSFAEHARRIASSSLWTVPEGAPPAPAARATAAGKGKGKRRRSPTPVRRAPSDGSRGRDSSPGFDADVEGCGPLAKVAARRGPGPDPDFGPAHGTKERLTIVVPGGKSEAYVAMAFERSCSLGGDDDVAGTVHHPSMSPPPPPPSSSSADRNPFAPKRDGARGKRGKGRTGLRIKIPVPSPLFMLSLRLASSCRVSDEVATTAEATTRADCPGSGSGSGFLAPMVAPPSQGGGGHCRSDSEIGNAIVEDDDGNDEDSGEDARTTTTTTTMPPPRNRDGRDPVPFSPNK
ncbi:hypothetical protein F5148DRAFT_1286412 [Russula earlei]|uniref:Uncharacterized protein n=1 Tax=Russula earlei TaxID=71964 RepID=A0ACC0U5R2_9AGAM|nr:hypothetical protein F5148DRAFT_1286412 [Russula earlei]